MTCRCVGWGRSQDDGFPPAAQGRGARAFGEGTVCVAVGHADELPLDRAEGGVGQQVGGWVVDGV
jgi:hypothetical protein